MFSTLQCRSTVTASFVSVLPVVVVLFAYPLQASWHIGPSGCCFIHITLKVFCMYCYRASCFQQY